jgi:non-specific serine/threonine protein kinase
MGMDGGPKYDGGASRLRPTGTIVGNYRLGDKIDEGGMGLVYRAVDTKLGRTVALKFLHPDLMRDPKARGRFIQEARAASSLDHPNICTIFQIDETRDGETFLAMAYYEGETLAKRVARGPLKLDEALEIAGQVAQGLSKAHARGIVHRDIRPANVFITQDGLVKILDFGLGKLAGEARLTKAGTALGTARCMSPEQARGDEADERSDVWALGAVLYEMVAGTPPFAGEHDRSVLHAIGNEEPEPLTARRSGVPMELGRIVGKTLAKDPAERYQHVEDLMVELKRLAKAVALKSAASRVLGAAEPPRAAPRSMHRPLLIALPIIIAALAVIVTASLLLHRSAERSEPSAIRSAAANGEWISSIAVLPFKDFSPEKDQEHFCDGITEDLITKLSRIPRLKVISQASAARYRNTTKTISEIAHELGVATILEGSVQKERARVRINAQLIEGADDAHLWAESYDRTLESTFEIQDEISLAIARALQMTLAPHSLERASTGGSSSIEAYEYLLRGKRALQSYMISRADADFESGVASFEKAIQLDSLYADAYALLGQLHGNRWVWNRDEASYAKAVSCLESGYRLNPEGSLQNVAMAAMFNQKQDYDGAYTHAKKALEANPNVSETNEVAGRFLRAVGLARRAIPYLAKAYELGPLLPQPARELAMCYFAVGSLDTAAFWYEKTLEIDPSASMARKQYAHILIYKNQLDRAEELIERAARIDSTARDLKYYRAYLLAARGERDRALALAQDEIVYCLLGMKEEAIRSIEKQAAEPHRRTRAYLYLWLTTDPATAPIRDDPRFQRIVAEQKKVYDEMLAKYGDL